MTALALTQSPTAIPEAARRYFGITAFRPGQKELLGAVLGGRDAFDILPTGAGKSRIFQLASLFLPRVVLVVTPLISLAEDQTDKLEQRRIAARRIDSTLRAAEMREAVGGVERNHLDLVYVTPERLERPEFLELLREVGVSLVDPG